MAKTATIFQAGCIIKMSNKSITIDGIKTQLRWSSPFKTINKRRHPNFCILITEQQFIEKVIRESHNRLHNGTITERMFVITTDGGVYKNTLQNFVYTLDEWVNFKTRLIIQMSRVIKGIPLEEYELTEKEKENFPKNLLNNFEL